MNFEVYKVVIGQVVRHFLTGIAVLLGAYGVSEAQQSALVEATVAIAVSIVVVIATQLWAYVSTKIAFQTETSDRPEEE